MGYSDHDNIVEKISSAGLLLSKKRKKTFIKKLRKRKLKSKHEQKEIFFYLYFGDLMVYLVSCRRKMKIILESIVRGHFQ